MFSYLHNRLVKIRNLRWETGPVIPSSIKQDTLSVREKEYFMQYSSLLSEYNGSSGLDLTADLEVMCIIFHLCNLLVLFLSSCPYLQPPKDLLIEVRVLKDVGGKIMTDSGPVSLDKGSIHFLRRFVIVLLPKHELLI